MTTHRKRIWMIAGGTLAGALVLTVFARARAPRPAAASSGHAARIAPVALARKTPIRMTLTLSGEFKPFQEVDLHAKVAGYIRTISVDVGDRVKTGQVLAVLEVPELARSSRRPTPRSTGALRRTRPPTPPTRRLKQVSDARPGLIAAQELEDANARDKQAEAQVAQA